MKITNKDPVASKSTDLMWHMQRVSGVDGDQIAMMMDLMNAHPNELVDATLKNFVATLKLAHSEPLAEMVSQARQQRILLEQQQKHQYEQTKRRIEGLQQDLASELDQNVLRVRALMQTMLGEMRQGVSRERMRDACNSQLILFLCERFDLELQSALRGWFRTHKILRITDEQFVQLARDVDNIPHGELRTLVEGHRCLQTTEYKNKFEYYMNHVRHSYDKGILFTGSHDWGV